MLAAILESGEPERLHTGLSLLVSTAVEGEPAYGLVSFRALPVLVEGRHAREIAELFATARELPELHLHVCAAAFDGSGLGREQVEAAVGPVMSTPRFLKETAGARLVVV